MITVQWTTMRSRKTICTGDYMACWHEVYTLLFCAMILNSDGKKSRSFHLESGNIRGEPLIVTYTSSNGLSCEIQVSLKSTNSNILVTLCFLFVVIGAVTWWISDVQSTRNTLFIVISLISLVILWIKYNYFDVAKESVIIVKNIGIQIKTTYKSGKQAVQFIDHKSIADIIINEGITMHKVIFYLAILARNHERSNEIKLIPLLTSFYPRLEGLKPIYHSIRCIIFNDDQECPELVELIKRDKIS